ncbi:uncharacterized protein LY89DRAFT_750502 [Mollisia scopiformis]|uniref:Uncharacterized protein n=1 Tax=Mollisia scopiformis TaxID=149040 RepID=A0A194X4V4_MOLSC|nr:uncharacterized protein LY89DRAFT_750502 [Mollisia scopiformis]KUJ15208.1 hypothetical protein LY89DRAFT_750502 [Mollisia scopiformis]
MSRKRFNREGFLVLDDGKTFLPIQRSPYDPTPSTQSDVNFFISELSALDFEALGVDEVNKMTRKLEKEILVIPLGSIGLIDYYIYCDIFLPGSLNGQKNSEGRAHVRESLRNLKFFKLNGNPVHSSVLVLPLGRLYASHHHHQHFLQSHWVIVLDKTQQLWALYADGIDNEDAVKETNGRPYRYEEAWDTAFGADRADGEKVVLLGSLKDIPFKEGGRLNQVKVQGRSEWSTTLSNFDLRKPMLSPNIVESHLRRDIRLISNPGNSKTKARNIFELEHEYGYLNFCDDVQRLNEPKGLIVGRTLMDAAWCRLVVQFFKASIVGRTALGIRKCVKSFHDAIMQGHGISAQKYWYRQANDYPGLNISEGSSNYWDCGHRGMMWWNSRPGSSDISVRHNAPLQKFLVAYVMKDDATENEEPMSLAEAEEYGLVKLINE